MDDNVRLKPRIQYVKQNELDDDWQEIEDVKVWYVSDADEDKYYDTTTGMVEPHRRSPGVCVAFTVGKREFSMTIPWKNLVHAMSDVIKEDERWREEQKAWKAYKKAHFPKLDIESVFKEASKPS